jgi:NADP-dependent 3-hydroxy acid dehydrogenase YdfG
MDRQAELAVVVGATGAFGKAMVDRLAAAGLGVVAVARSADSLAMPCGTGCRAWWPVPPTSPTMRPSRRLPPRWTGPVRMVVHGPGVAVAGGILTAPTGSMVDAVNIKVGGLLRLTRAVDGRLKLNALELVLMRPCYK